MMWRLAVVALLAACGAPDRLDPPPPPSPGCVADWGVCEFAGECCSFARCQGNRCEPISELVVPDAACVPDQVDVAIVLDLSDSMDPWIESIARSLDDTLSAIPPTTTVQVWVTPPSIEREGEYALLSPRGTPEQARLAIADLSEGEGGVEATLDVTSHLLRSSDAWRYGTTVRAILIVSDEQPHSVYSPSTSTQDICNLRTPTDRVVVFTRSLFATSWGECFDVRQLSGIWQVPAILADPCEVMR